MVNTTHLMVTETPIGRVYKRATIKDRAHNFIEIMRERLAWKLMPKYMIEYLQELNKKGRMKSNA